MTTPQPDPDLSSSVTPTGNPLVASYAVTLPAGATVYVEFGLDTTYGTSTSTTAAPVGGGIVTTLVAGMLPGTTYYMRAVIHYANGWTFYDVAHPFQTGALPTDIVLPNLIATTFPGQTPTPGVELINVIDPSGISAVSDLAGNVIWFYDNAGDKSWGGYAFPIKFLANGHLLASITNMYTDSFASGANSVLREIDLAGNTVQGANGPRELYLADMNAQLQNVATSQGSIVVAKCYSHDFLALPNGHVIQIVQEYREVEVGNPPTLQTVMGDALVDLDENFNVAWVWSAFDWLDVNRQPPPFRPPNEAFDWTHCNAVILAPDGNLLLSSRSQSWILKLNYQGGSGDGAVVWALGLDGTFALQGSDPIDWFAAQHFPWVIATDGVQITQLAMFDNGNDRNRSSADPLFSRAAVFNVDETKMTASLAWQYMPSPGLYSYWGGNVKPLASGNYEINMSEPCAANALPPATDLPSLVVEVTRDSSQQLVWQMQATIGGVYRSYRIPSLYPGVQW